MRSSGSWHSRQPPPSCGVPQGTPEPMGKSSVQTEQVCYRYWRRRPVRATGFRRSNQPDLTVVGPDNPLSMGVVDLFQAHGCTIWGPNQKAAQFEASKAFSQTFMETYGIPTARSGVFSEVGAAREFARSLGGCCAVKADGLALGKGVLITSNEEEADRAIEQVMVDKSFGDAGKQVVIQEKLEGLEVSLHALCDGSRYLLFDTSQDHKRAMDGDLGWIPVEWGPTPLPHS